MGHTRLSWITETKGLFFVMQSFGQHFRAWSELNEEFEDMQKTEIFKTKIDTPMDLVDFDFL